MALVGSFVVYILLFATTILVRGTALLDLWGWYAVPLGAPTMVFWQALGLGTLTLMYTMTNSADKKESATTLMLYSLFMNLILWGVGALYHLAWVNNFLGLN